VSRKEAHIFFCLLNRLHNNQRTERDATAAVSHTEATGTTGLPLRRKKSNVFAILTRLKLTSELSGASLEGAAVTPVEKSGTGASPGLLSAPDLGDSVRCVESSDKEDSRLNVAVEERSADRPVCGCASSACAGFVEDAMGSIVVLA
jgi:hypothetical protein